MQLVENGQVDLDMPVIKYVPYFRIADERYKTITVRQMLTHTSGMPDEGDYEWDKPQSDDGALERYVRGLGNRNLRLEFEPGSKFQYSNMAYEILGDLIAKVSGTSFEDYVRVHILEPLRMAKSTLLLKDADPKLMTWGTCWTRKAIHFAVMSSPTTVCIPQARICCQARLEWHVR